VDAADNSSAGDAAMTAFEIRDAVLEEFRVVQFRDPADEEFAVRLPEPGKLLVDSTAATNRERLGYLGDYRSCSPSSVTSVSMSSTGVAS
jgi:hypothetical protein